MKLPRSGPDHLSLEVIELADQERPPMLRIPEYLERRKGAQPAAGRPGGGGHRHVASDPPASAPGTAPASLAGWRG